MLYPNYEGFESFSTNHLEKGEHNHLTIADEKKKAQFTVPLMSTSFASSLLDLPDGRLPGWTSLPIIDLWGSLTTEEEIIERGWQSVVSMELCPAQELRIDGVPTYEARELLCPRWRKEEKEDDLVELLSLGTVVRESDPLVIPPPLVVHPADDEDVASRPSPADDDANDEEALARAKSQTIARLTTSPAQQAQELNRVADAAQRRYEEDLVEKGDALRELGEQTGRQEFSELGNEDIETGDAGAVDKDTEWDDEGDEGEEFI